MPRVIEHTDGNRHSPVRFRAPAPAQKGKILQQEANTMENPIYRIKIEVVGDEKGRKIDETLRGGGRV